MRIRGLPEPADGEDQVEKMGKIFKLLLGREEAESSRIERVQRIRRPKSIPTEVLRDIIIRFQSYEEKTQIWGIMRGKPPLKYESAKLQIFPDLSHETLRRRRLLKPLLDLMQSQEI